MQDSDLGMEIDEKTANRSRSTGPDSRQKKDENRNECLWFESVQRFSCCLVGEGGFQLQVRKCSSVLAGSRLELQRL